MKSRPVATALAIALGAIVLLAYFAAEMPVLAGLKGIRAEILHWAILVGAMAINVGLLNLATVHFNKARRGEKGAVYSALALFAMIITIGVMIADNFLNPDKHTYRQFLFDAIIVPVESSMMALLTVTLIYATVRLFRRRFDMSTAVFFVTLLLAMVANMPLVLASPLSWVSGVIRLVFVEGLAVGGARGILIGVALGTLVTGLRLIMGFDRPYGGK
jgi:hypothetical protein